MTSYLASGVRQVKQDPLAYLERIRLAMKAGNTGLVTVLAGQMPADYQTIASAIISLANNPNTVLTFARTTGATDFTRQMAGGGGVCQCGAAGC